eukprot:TRINITY_DN10278_c0_g1_i1.p1 TRINITY_DN10278_c0_g1~~TRINITY_DN10278_c0_g1_i1.p1  ORF type:complete len:1885 (-),score=305.15 TRINITY_DN10278_c0_g1_i1:55-5658(-)
MRARAPRSVASGGTGAPKAVPLPTQDMQELGAALNKATSDVRMLGRMLGVSTVSERRARDRRRIRVRRPLLHHLVLPQPATLWRFKDEQVGMVIHSKPNPRFLIATPNRLAAAAYRVMFRRWDVELHVARTGIETLELMEQHVFDCLFLEIDLPEIQGYEIAARIRGVETREGLHRVAIVALITPSADGTVPNNEILELCCEAGMDRYLLKPLGLHLRAVLKMFLFRDYALGDFQVAVRSNNWTARYPELWTLFTRGEDDVVEEFKKFGDTEAQRRQLELISAMSDDASEKVEFLKNFSRQRNEDTHRLEELLRQLQQRIREYELKVTQLETTIEEQQQAQALLQWSTSRNVLGGGSAVRAQLDAWAMRNKKAEKENKSLRSTVKSLLTSEGTKGRTKMRRIISSQHKEIEQLERTLMEAEEFRAYHVWPNFEGSHMYKERPFASDEEEELFSWFRQELVDMRATLQHTVIDLATEFKATFQHLVEFAVSRPFQQFQQEFLEVSRRIAASMPKRIALSKAEIREMVQAFILREREYLRIVPEGMHALQRFRDEYLEEKRRRDADLSSRSLAVQVEVDQLRALAAAELAAAGEMEMESQTFLTANAMLQNTRAQAEARRRAAALRDVEERLDRAVLVITGLAKIKDWLRKDAEKQILSFIGKIFVPFTDLVMQLLPQAVRPQLPPLDVRHLDQERKSQFIEDKRKIDASQFSDKSDALYAEHFVDVAGCNSSDSDDQQTSIVNSKRPLARRRAVRGVQYLVGTLSEHISSLSRVMTQLHIDAIQQRIDGKGETRKKTDPKTLASQIFVGNLAQTTVDATMRELFLPFGEIQEVRVFSHTDANTSLAYIQFGDETVARKAAEMMDGAEVEGRKIVVQQRGPGRSFDANAPVGPRPRQASLKRPSMKEWVERRPSNVSQATSSEESEAPREVSVKELKAEEAPKKRTVGQKQSSPPTSERVVSARKPPTGKQHPDKQVSGKKKDAALKSEKKATARSPQRSPLGSNRKIGPDSASPGPGQGPGAVTGGSQPPTVPHSPAPATDWIPIESATFVATPSPTHKDDDSDKPPTPVAGDARVNSPRSESSFESRTRAQQMKVLPAVPSGATLSVLQQQHSEQSRALRALQRKQRRLLEAASSESHISEADEEPEPAQPVIHDLHRSLLRLGLTAEQEVDVLLLLQRQQSQEFMRASQLVQQSSMNRVATVMATAAQGDPWKYETSYPAMLETRRLNHGLVVQYEVNAPVDAETVQIPTASSKSRLSPEPATETPVVAQEAVKVREKQQLVQEAQSKALMILGRNVKEAVASHSSQKGMSPAKVGLIVATEQALGNSRDARSPSPLRRDLSYSARHVGIQTNPERPAVASTLAQPSPHKDAATQTDEVNSTLEPVTLPTWWRFPLPGTSELRQLQAVLPPDLQLALQRLEAFLNEQLQRHMQKQRQTTAPPALLPAVAKPAPPETTNPNPTATGNSLSPVTPRSTANMRATSQRTPMLGTSEELRSSDDEASHRVRIAPSAFSQTNLLKRPLPPPPSTLDSAILHISQSLPPRPAFSVRSPAAKKPALPEPDRSTNSVLGPEVVSYASRNNNAVGRRTTDAVAVLAAVLSPQPPQQAQSPLAIGDAQPSTMSPSAPRRLSLSLLPSPPASQALTTGESMHSLFTAPEKTPENQPWQPPFRVAPRLQREVQESQDTELRIDGQRTGPQVPPREPRRRSRPLTFDEFKEMVPSIAISGADPVDTAEAYHEAYNHYQRAFLAINLLSDPESSQEESGAESAGSDFEERPDFRHRGSFAFTNPTPAEAEQYEAWLKEFRRRQQQQLTRQVPAYVSNKGHMQLLLSATSTEESPQTQPAPPRPPKAKPKQSKRRTSLKHV